jgi:hypothetical protein
MNVGMQEDEYNASEVYQVLDLGNMNLCATEAVAPRPVPIVPSEWCSEGQLVTRKW